MNQTEQILLQAIQKSLWNTDITFPEDTDWNAVLKEAEDQAVLGVVIGVAPADVQKEWKARASAGTAHFVRILHYQEQIYHLLKENDIPMAILKGTAAAIYYPNPAQRTMGDIDYLVPLEYFDKAKEVLSENGYCVEDNPIAPRHMHVFNDGISFEQHRFFSRDGVDVEKYVSSGLNHIEIRTIYGNAFPMLPKTANGMVLLGHIAQHLQDGLGLRQVLDWMMYVYKELDDDFWYSCFQNAAVETGLEKVAITITKACELYLGLSTNITWCDNADLQLCDTLVDVLFISGNFNRKRGKGGSIEKVAANVAGRGLFRYLQKAGERNWKLYHKHKWLKPLAWIYQIGRYARQGFRTKRKSTQILEDMELGKQRSALLKKLGIQVK